jgi:hypothetical protein
MCDANAQLGPRWRRHTHRRTAFVRETETMTHDVELVLGLAGGQPTSMTSMSKPTGEIEHCG